MSKMDDLRAMREARFERTSSAQPRPPARVRPTVTPVAPVAPVAEVPPAEAGVPAADALCGHRNIGGRTCTRERGHAAKSHRYS